MKIKDLTNNSPFTELRSDEAAKVNGGNGWYPSLSSDIFLESLGSDTIVAHFLKQNQELLTLHRPDFRTSGIPGINANVAGILTPLIQNGIRF